MDTKTKLIKAAISIFAKKGKHGTTMEEVAKKAGANKAMVYYYYQSKENLLIEVIAVIMRRILSDIILNLSQTPLDTDDPVSKVKHFTSAHFRAFTKNRDHARILIETMTHDPDDIKNALERLQERDPNAKMPERVLQVFNEGVQRGVFRETDYKQIIICFIGMNLMYFMMQPIASALMGLKIEDEKTFLEDHEKCITDMFLYGISKCNCR